MVLYAVNLDALISPPAVIALGSVVMFFNGMEVVIDILIAKEREHQRHD